jgi:Zn-dependent peptidase ImmA (M78 family)/DNA-binding XRE family transcriptional regulator
MPPDLIGANLKHARQHLRLSQTTVGKEVGLPRQAISAIEAGKREVTIAVLVKLANLYRLQAGDILKAALAPPSTSLPGVQRRGPAGLDDHDWRELQAFNEELRRRPPLMATARLDDVRQPGLLRSLAAIADQVRRKTDLDSAPINVYKALACTGVYVRMTALKRLSGAFLRGGPNWSPGVLINSDQPSDRQRYSAAHELGHYLLRHADQEDRIVSPLGRRFEPKEVEADRFAAELLMPAALIESEAKHVRKYDRLAEQVYILADKFLVSFEAMIYRLATVGLVSASEKRLLLDLRPSDIEKQLRIERKARRAFDPKRLQRICSVAKIGEELLRNPDGIRHLQELAFAEYAGEVPEPDRADSSASLYEKVALWAAKNYEMPHAA